MIKKQIKKILVALDGSENSFRGLNNAIIIARNSHARIVGVYVTQLGPPESVPQKKYIEEYLLKNIFKFLKKAKTHSAQNGILFDEKILYGGSGPKIVKFAHDENFDLIVIGSTGRTSDYIQSDEGWFPTDYSQRIWTEPVKFDKSSESVVSGVTVVLYDENDEFAGVLKGYIDMKNEMITVTELLETQSYHSSMRVSIVDSQGLMIFSELVGDVEKDLLLSDFGQSKQSFAEIPKDEKDHGYIITDSQDSQLLVSFASPHGFLKEQELGWYTIVEFERDEIMNSFNILRQTLFALSFSIALSGIVLGIIISQRISSPINNLTKVSKNMIKGDYSKRADITGSDEQRTLSQSFNVMADTILESKNTIEEQINNLKENDKKKSEFSAMMSHELKTPLVPILGYAEMLEEELSGKISKDHHSMLESIRNNSMKLKSMINKTLLTHNLELNKIKWRISKCNVNEYIEKIISSNSNLLKNKKISLVNIISDKSLQMMTDGSKLEEVFTNLIQNAVDFSENNSEISIDAIKSNDFVEFRIKDQGKGIPIGQQKKLFQKFYQADTSVTRKHGGTGLGLAICKEIVNGLKGKIWIKSNEDKGITVFFTQPISN